MLTINFTLLLQSSSCKVDMAIYYPGMCVTLAITGKGSFSEMCHTPTDKKAWTCTLM